LEKGKKKKRNVINMAKDEESLEEIKSYVWRTYEEHYREEV
jgi:hypothetical protein